MNEIMNKFLLVGDKFMPEMHLKQPGFTYSACGSFLDEYTDIGTRWIALFCNKTEFVHFDSFGVEHIPKEIKKTINNKNIIVNTFQI